MRSACSPAILVSALLLGAAVPAGAQQPDRAGLIDIGGGREMFLECRGSGAPTVVLIAGGFEAGWIWTYALAPGDPVHDAQGDAFSAGQGTPQKLPPSSRPSPCSPPETSCGRPAANSDRAVSICTRAPLLWRW